MEVHFAVNEIKISATINKQITTAKRNRIFHFIWCSTHAFLSYFLLLIRQKTRILNFTLLTAESRNDNWTVQVAELNHFAFRMLSNESLMKNSIFTKISTKNFWTAVILQLIKLWTNDLAFNKIIFALRPKGWEQINLENDCNNVWQSFIL